MRTSQLVSRDPARAAIMGAYGPDIGGSFGAEFGNDFGSDFGDDFGDETDIGDDFGDDFGAAAAAPVTRSQAIQAVRMLKAAKARTQNRGRLLQPNAGSNVKVERYGFHISEAIVLGTAQTFTALTGQPDTMIRPQRVSMNAPAEMYAYVQSLRVANVLVSSGVGVEDAYFYNANGVGQVLDMPTLEPANRAQVAGNYTGFTPPGYNPGTAAFFCVSFKGPSSITA